MKIETKHIGLLVIAALVWVAFGPTIFTSASHDDQFEAIPVRSQTTYPIQNAVFQQDVDHFSDDDRAMSPRSWGIVQPDFGNSKSIPDERRAEPRNEYSSQEDEPPAPDTNRRQFQQIENSRIKTPPRHFESKPLDPVSGNDPGSSFSSPVPGELGLPEQDNLEKGKDDKRELKSRVESNEETDQANSDSTVSKQATTSPTIAPNSNELPLASGFDGTQYGQSFNNGIDVAHELVDLEHVSNYCGCPDCRHLKQTAECNCNSCRRSGKKQRFRTKRARPKRGSHTRPVESCSSCGACFNENCDQQCECNGSFCPKFDESLGHKYPTPITRGIQGSSAKEFSFEENNEYPPASEILAQSIFFSEVDFMFLQPSFQGNTAITSVQPGVATSATPFNFDLDPAFRVMGGFESDYGPGFAGEYFQYDNNSDVVQFASNGATSGESRVFLDGFNDTSSLVANGPGQTLQTLHSLEVHSSSVYAFKAIEFKRAYVNGRFGLQVVSVEHKLESNLLDAGGNQTGNLNNITNINAWGPRFGIDYIRKIGHTPAQLVASATTSLLFGDRDQTVVNSTTDDFTNLGSDEFMSVFDIFFGVQGKQIRGEKRNTTFRVGFVNQTWIGGGNAIDANGDFGFQGISFTLGFNR